MSHYRYLNGRIQPKAISTSLGASTYLITLCDFELTLSLQSTARKNELPLDKMSLACEVTKKQKEEMQAPPREGACIHGLFMEGAR